VLVVHFVDADGVIARPLAIVEAFAEGESAFVERGSDGQGSLLLRMRGGIIVARRDEGQALEGVHPGVLGKECAYAGKRGT